MNRISIPNLLIIAGTGSKSIRTDMACRIISRLNSRAVAVKITPHYHELTEGVTEIMNGKGYSIREETDAGSSKDTSLMLKAGAARSFLISAWKADMEDVFIKFMALFPSSVPVVCDSITLRNHIEPGLFILMVSDKAEKRDDEKHLADYKHLPFNPEAFDENEILKIRFEGGRWTCD
ncbi:MAG TPA: hypothetical protein VK213_00150 [Bacteroidales bacterium]|nr:hypothetical protein [Bacteroidales bacterium]